MRRYRHLKPANTGPNPIQYFFQVFEVKTNGHKRKFTLPVKRLTKRPASLIFILALLWPVPGQLAVIPTCREISFRQLQLRIR